VDEGSVHQGLRRAEGARQEVTTRLQNGGQVRGGYTSGPSRICFA
jgi:hypothetical protein